MNHPERINHLAILAYLRTALLGNPVIHHSPNELGIKGKEAARQVAKHKHLGMEPGFPDLVAFTFHGPLFFEVKAAANKPTAPQEACHADLRRMNYRVAVVRSIDDVRAALAAWGIPTRDGESGGELIP